MSDVTVVPIGKLICRACLAHPIREMYSLFLDNTEMPTGHRNQTESVGLAEIYSQCTQLSTSSINDISEFICMNCHQKLIEFYKFRKMCTDSFNFLLRQSKLAVITKEECDSSDGFPAVPNEPVDNGDLHATTIDSPGVDTVQTKFDFDRLSPSIENSFDGESDEYKPTWINSSNNNHSNGNDNSMEVTGEADGEPPADDHPNAAQSNDQSKEKNKPPIRKRSKRIQNTKEKVSKEIRTRQSTKNDANDDESMEEKPKKRFFCHLCPKSYNRRQKLNEHVAWHDGIRFQCEKCEKSFTRASYLKVHMDFVHPEEGSDFKGWTCDVESCGKVFQCKQTLRAHILRLHSDQAEALKNKLCEHCGKGFRAPSALKKHLYIHTGITPHVCHICSKKYPTSYKLKEHLLRHEGIKNFKCEVCGLRKTTMHELNVHMNYHTREKQFPCKFCDMVFSNAGNQSRHMKIVHCGVKAYQCTYCDRSFGKSETLKHHVMIHTGEKPHECTTCGKRFIQPIALKKHLLVHNKNK